MADPIQENLATNPPGPPGKGHRSVVGVGAIATNIYTGDDATELTGASTPALREPANEFRSLPDRIGEYAARVDAWRAAASAHGQQDWGPDLAAELAELMEVGLRLFHVLRDVDQKWAAEIRSHRVPHDWKDSQKIASAYRLWSEPTERLMDVIDRPGSAITGHPRYGAFHQASIDAWFYANVDLEAIRASEERLNQRLRPQEACGARRKSPDQVRG